MTNVLATIAREIAKNEKCLEGARAKLVAYIRENGGLTKENEREFDVEYVMVKASLRSKQKATAYFERGATRPEKVKKAMDAARKTRQLARKDAGVAANDKRGGARNTDKPETEETKKPAATMIPSAVTKQEAAAFLLSYSNKNAKVLPTHVMNAIKKFATDTK